MDDVLPEYRLMQFSTELFAPRDRFEVWRDVLTRKLLHVAIDPLSERPFRAKADLRVLPGLRIGSGAIAATISHRTPQIAAADNDDIAVLINLTGPFLVRGAAGDLVLSEGDACLVECCVAASYVRTAPGRLMCIRLARGELRAFARRLDDALCRLIPANTEALQLLRAYAGTLHDGPVEMSPALSRAVVDHVGDLVALLIGANGEGASLAAGRGLKAARLGAIKTYIRERLSAFDLNVDEVAAHQGVSPRYVRQLFETEGLSFSRYVAEERLAQAHAMLTSPSFAAQPVSAIAYDAGFGDLSYFNKTFKRRFRATPTDVRAEAAESRRVG
ncbi:MAG: AraC family transcriptional regulator [Caulobacterales bacterium]